MPLYEYQCKKCGHRFERIQKFSDAMVKKCPDCGGKVEQMISAPAVQFKGAGWYVTDYARKGSTAAGSKWNSDSKRDSGKDSAKDSGSKESGPKESGSKEKDSGAKKETKATKER